MLEAGVAQTVCSETFDWVDMGAATPAPYSRTLFEVTESDQWEWLKRHETCEQVASWRYRLACRNTPMMIRTGDRFCGQIPANRSLGLHGDSLLRQLVSSWQARLLDAGQHCQTAPSSKGPATAFADSSQVQLLRWSGGGPILSLRSDNFSFAAFLRHQLGSASAACNASYLARGAEAFHLLEVDADTYLREVRPHAALVVNTFAHFNHVILNLVASRCVADQASATELAMGYWQAQLQLHAQALAGLRPRTRSFYLVSPAPMDLFVRRKGKRKGRRKGENITRPLPAAAVAGLMTAPTAAHENDVHNHNLYAAVNHMSIEAFIASGHGVIDALFEPASRRVDAHPASGSSGSSDSLHFCMPGVPDYVLDAVLGTVWRRSTDHSR